MVDYEMFISDVQVQEMIRNFNGSITQEVFLKIIIILYSNLKDLT